MLSEHKYKILYDIVGFRSCRRQITYDTTCMYGRIVQMELMLPAFETFTDGVVVPIFVLLSRFIGSSNINIGTGN